MLFCVFFCFPTCCIHGGRCCVFVCLIVSGSFHKCSDQVMASWLGERNFRSNYFVVVPSAAFLALSYSNSSSLGNSSTVLAGFRRMLLTDLNRTRN